MSIEGERRESLFKPKRIEVFEKDFWDTESLADLILEKLKKYGLYKPSLLYTGFDSNNIRKLKKNPGETTFCGTEAMFCENKHNDANALWYAQDIEGGAIAVYDDTKLRSMGLDEYEILEPNSVIAIISLKK